MPGAVPTRRKLIRRLLLHLGFSLALLTGSLAIGMWGYGHFEHMAWRDAFVNSAMLMSGMGPLQQNLSDDGKVFAGIYALYAGLIVIAVTGLLLAPAVHHVMRQAHWEDREQ